MLVYTVLTALAIGGIGLSLITWYICFDVSLSKLERPIQKTKSLLRSRKLVTIINDDYCDLPDGSDEFRTSACSNLLAGVAKFACGDGKLIFASRVNDNVIDCADESDELSMK